jgi:hypothetical protein
MIRSGMRDIIYVLDSTSQWPFALPLGCTVPTHKDPGASIAMQIVSQNVAAAGNTGQVLQCFLLILVENCGDVKGRIRQFSRTDCRRSQLLFQCTRPQVLHGPILFARLCMFRGNQLQYLVASSRLVSS